MVKYFVLSSATFVLGIVSMASCNTQASDPTTPQAIELLTAQDQFLHNFIVPDQNKLSIGISREDALFAGATIAGYTDLVAQINRINEIYNTESYKYWRGKVQQWQVKTKTMATCDVPYYNKYNVPEQDKFLENFVYVENETITLKISEEKALLCGATIEGYQSLRNELKTLDNMVKAGITTYNEIKNCFDSKRDFILQHKTLLSSLTKALTPSDRDTPPQTYAIIELLNGNREGSCIFYGSEEIVAVLSANYFCSMAVLTDLETAKTLTLIGYSAHDFFKAGLIYPEGGHYSFHLTKGTDNYDVTARFVEKH